MKCRRNQLELPLYLINGNADPDGFSKLLVAAADSGKPFITGR